VITMRGGSASPHVARDPLVNFTAFYWTQIDLSGSKSI
jgi:hypothetical protein